jgi:hypothetical protein
LFVDQATPVDAAVDISANSSAHPDAGEEAPASSVMADGAASTDATAEAEAAARPAKPCHLVPAGDAVQSITFSQQGYRFHQEGMLLRRTASGPHVIQYGAVGGAGTDGWGDPALYAAEYDVSVWPPREVHPPTRFADADESGSQLVELPGNRLLFAWVLQVDNGGIGPYDLLFETADATSWQLGAPGTLVKWGTSPSPPALTATKDGFLLAYRQVSSADAGPPWLLGAVGSFALDGSAHGDAAPTWSFTDGFEPRQYLARTETDALAVVAFADCGAGLVSSVYCEPRTLVVLRLIEPGGGGPLVLQKVAAVPQQNADNVVLYPALSSDQNGHDWLTWWEAPQTDSGVFPQDLYAMPLTSAGAPRGPIESWFASDHVGLLTSGAWAPSASVGPLGAIYPVSTYRESDSGVSMEQVHLVHRQLDDAEPVEDIAFDTAPTSFTVVAAQIAEPRSVIVGYATHPPGANYHGELARYTCAEDAD